MARLDVIEKFHGISFPGHLHNKDSMQFALKFPFQDTDILIVSYPKSGKKRGKLTQIHVICSVLKRNLFLSAVYTFILFLLLFS